MALFDVAPVVGEDRRPLAEVMRPSTWSQFEGFEGLDRGLRERLLRGQGKPPSLLLWGPPGVGKTTLARLVGRGFDCEFIQFSAVLQGVKDVREVVADAKKRTRNTLLFVDEIHRFTRAQQDAFLPHIEDGTISFIGATTENPSFYLNGALISRARVVVLKPLTLVQIGAIVERAAGSLGRNLTAEAVQRIAHASSADGRRAISLLEDVCASVMEEGRVISEDDVARHLGEIGVYRYDRNGEEHYDMISAFIKSLRGSDADAAIFWGFRMLESGEDPLFILRRLIIFASEDVGNADPRALPLAVAAYEAFERVGMPEGEIPIAQAITFLASAPKSNRSYEARNKVKESVRRHPVVTVPKPLRNAPTKLMKAEGYGDGYQYPHESPAGFIPGIRYLPTEVGNERFYEPKDVGFEKTIREIRRLRGQE